MAIRSLQPAICTISTTDTRTSLDSILSAVATGEDVILERDGTPTAAIISMDEYRDLLATREAARRAEALRLLDAVAEESRVRNSDLSEADTGAIAQEVSQELCGEREQEVQQRQRDARFNKTRPQ